MAGYDGYIRISTKIDTGDVNSQMKKLQTSVGSASSRLDELNKKMEALKQKKIPTEQYQALQKELSASSSKMATLAEKMEKFKALGGDIDSKKFASMKYDMDKLSASVDVTKSKIKEMEDAGEAFQDVTQTTEYKDLNKQIDEAKDKLVKVNNESGKLTNEIDDSVKSAEKLEPAFSKTQNILKNIVRKLAAVLSVAAIVKFGKEAVGLASDLAEVDNVVVSKSFGDMRGEIDALADTAIKTLGMSRLTAYQTGSTFMSMGKSMLDSSEDAKTMALELTKLTGNMSSFFNVSQDLASTALKSIYTGETETLKQYGVVMTEVNLKQFAMEQGITKAYSAMTQSEKVMLRYQYVTSQLSFIGDDFVDTQDSWANQTRILTEQWKEFMSVIGSGLVTVFTPAINFLNNILFMLISISKTIGSVLSELFGIQVQSAASSASVIEDVASEYEDAADSADEYADSVESAARAADGATASFDDLNVLSKPSNSSSSSGTTAGGTSSIGMEEVAVEGDSAAIQLKGRFSDFFDYVTRLKNRFVDDFRKSWNDLNVSLRFSGIQNSINGIKTSLAGIFADGAVIGAADNYIGSVVSMFSKVAVAVISVGAVIAQNLLGGIEIYLQENADNIKGFLVTMFDIKADIANLIGDYVLAFANIFQVFGSEAAMQITADIIQMFSDVFLAVGAVLLMFGADLLHLFLDPFINNQELIKETLGNLLGAIEPVITTISDMVSQIVNEIVKLYDEHIHPFIQSLTEGITEIQEIFLTFWNTYMNPLIEKWGTKFRELYEKYLKPAISNIMDGIGGVIDIVKRLWEKYVQPFISWCIENILPKLVPIFDRIMSVTHMAASLIGNAIKGISSIFKNVVEMIKNIINGDWKAAWNNMKAIIKAPINGILSGIEIMVNSIIGGLNKMIKAINKLEFTMPDWVPIVGGKSLGFEIKEIKEVFIPRLANGGITTGSTLANIGEAGREAVLPLDVNTGWMDDLADRLASRIPVYQGDNRPVYLQIDGKTFARLYNPYGKAEDGRIGISFT